MNIIKPQPSKKDEIIWQSDKVEIATIPADYAIAVQAGPLLIVNGVSLIDGKLFHKDIVGLKEYKTMEIHHHDEENKYMVLGF